MEVEKTERIQQLIESRTALLEAISGLCSDDFEASFGECCLSLKKRLAHIAVVDWDVAKAIREMAQGKTVVGFYQFSGRDWTGDRAAMIEPRCSSEANEVVSEVVLSLQALLDEVRSLPEEHFFTKQPDNAGHSVVTLLDATLHCTQQHCEEIRSFLKPLP